MPNTEKNKNTITSYPATITDLTLTEALEQEHARFITTQIPIITVSASYREDVKGFYGYTENEQVSDVVFSRAHYSMALGAAIAAWGAQVDPKKAYVVDPTNFVSDKEWNKILFTQFVGKTIARQSFLKRVKDLIDSFARQKLPILSSITPPLTTLSKNITKPILSFHIAAGNILAEQGKTVLQVITDPHVREEYLLHADAPHFFYCVFDEATKAEALEKAAFLGKKIDPEKIIVTGPPIDPRIVRARTHKQAWRSGPLRLCLTTGGLGTNTAEIKSILSQLLPLLRRRTVDEQTQVPPLELMVYASTHADVAKMVTQMAKTARIKLETISTRDYSVAQALTATPARSIHRNRSETTKLTLLYHPQIVDANELLIEHAFPWADGFITKPSGDMAYDATAAGCFLLTLKEWGEWEFAIRERFETLGIARRAVSDKIVQQLTALTTTSGKSQSWVEKAMNQALTLDSTYLQGSEKIIEAYKKLT